MPDTSPSAFKMPALTDCKAPVEININGLALNRTEAGLLSIAALAEEQNHGVGCLSVVPKHRGQAQRLIDLGLLEHVARNEKWLLVLTPEGRRLVGVLKDFNE